MKKDSLIKNERNHARYLLFVLEKLEVIDSELTARIKNKQSQCKKNKSILSKIKMA